MESKSMPVAEFGNALKNNSKVGESQLFGLLKDNNEEGDEATVKG